MNIPKNSFLVVFVLILMMLPAEAQLSDNLRISGYTQGMALRISAEMPEPIGDETWLEYRIQNRLNVAWYPDSNWGFHWQMRTRLFAGDLVKDIPGYANAIDTDEGLANLSWMPVDRNSWLLHYIPDRLYLEYDSGHWNIRVGRQRVNWGVAMITNPNDLFNIYSFYEFDYIERPGSDAVRIQRFLGFGSRFELVVSPDREIENSVAGLLYTFHSGGYDVQLIGAYYRNRLAAGTGFAGNLFEAGLKGETMFYFGERHKNGDSNFNAIITLSLDYMFSSGLFVVTEALYNKDGGRDEFQIFAEDLSPDNPSFSTWQFSTQGTYPIHPLVDGTLALIYYPDEDAVFIAPSMQWSVITDLDFLINAQFFLSGSNSAFNYAGNLVAASLRYSF